MPLLHPLPTPLIALLLTSLLPTASAASSAAEPVDIAAFWLSFSLLIIVSAAESAFSVTWTRIRVISDGIHPCELSCRICGREIFVNSIDPETASEIATEGIPAGFHSGAVSSVTFSHNDIVMNEYSNSSGCSCCGGWETRHTEVHGGATEAVIDKFGSLMLVPTLLIRRFDPTASVKAPAGLVDNVKSLVGNAKNIVKPGEDGTVVRVLEHAVHLFVGLTDVALGVAVLALIPGSPQTLYNSLKDPTAPMTFQNYSTLFLMFWLLGALLLLCMIPLRSARRSIQIFGWPGAIAYVITGFASLALFCLGCWKIDFARRHHMPWTPMLSYWIGGASAISFPICGLEVFHTFGVVGLVFMLIHTFD